jgi:hypothetical protein
MSPPITPPAATPARQAPVLVDAIDKLGWDARHMSIFG